MEKRNQLENMLIPGVVATRASFEELHTRLVLDKLRTSLAAFNAEDFLISDERGRRWRVRARIWAGIMDLDVSCPFLFHGL